MAKLADWPVADADALDRELGTRVHKLSAGHATATDVSEATGLIRKRAEHMMPGVFEKLRKKVASSSD